MILESTICPEVETAAALRRKAFVDVAREAFFANGYAGTTMSSIAARVGGSKTTLWSYFPSKQDLFEAVLDDIVDHYGQALSAALPPPEDFERGLAVFGRAMMATILSEPIIALHRLVIGEAGRFPELASIFWDRGPKRGKERLAAFIAQAMAIGRLRDGDPMLAALQFSGMCQSGSYQNAILGVDTGLTSDAVERDVDAAVDSFLRAWKVTPGSRNSFARSGKGFDHTRS